MKSNREFRQQACENVSAAIKEMNHSFAEFTKNNENYSHVGTMFFSIKQTRIINRLKELLK